MGFRGWYVVKLVLNAFWLAIIGVGCFVSALVVALWLDRAIYRRRLGNE